MTTIDPRIVGTWRMKGTVGRDDAGHVLAPPYVPAGMGLVVFQADGRMMAVLCDGRPSLPSGEPRQFMSYAGNYSFDGTTLATRVDASSGREPRRRRTGAHCPIRERLDGAGAAAKALYAGIMQHQELSWERIAA